MHSARPNPNFSTSTDGFLWGCSDGTCLCIQLPKGWWGSGLLLWVKHCLPKGCCKRVMRQRGCLSERREGEGDREPNSSPHSCCSWECMNSGQAAAVPAQCKPTCHVQSPVFPYTHTSTHSKCDLLWSYWTIDTFFFLKFWIKIWESCSSGVAVPGAVSLEPPSLNTQSLLLMLALENAMTVSWHDSSTGVSVCAPGGAVSDGKAAKAEWCCTEQTWQNIPSEYFEDAQNVGSDAEICVKT